MPYINADGVKLHMQIMGEGPLLVMCHGLISGSMATWYFLAATELAKRFTVVLYDQRGHGLSDLAPTGYDTETMSQDLAAVIANCKILAGGSSDDDSEKIHLVGFSYGALIALQYAIRNKHRIASLFLIDAPLPASRYISPSLEGLNSAEDIQALPEQFQGMGKAGGRIASRIRERFEYLMLQSTLRDDLKMSADIKDSQLLELDIPVKCLYGRQSACRDVASRLTKNLPNASLDWLDCGHYIVNEAPADMMRAINRFLQ